MKKIILILIVVFAATLSAATEKQANKIDSIIEGYIESSENIGKEQRIIYLGPEVLVSSEDIADAQVSEIQGTHVINVVFTS